MFTFVKTAATWLLGIALALALPLTANAQNTPEKLPEFPGGQQALIQYLVNAIVYPPAAKEQKAEGTVVVQFVVKKSGKIAKVAVARTSGNAALDAEALRVVKSMPNWEPAQKDGKKVSAQMKLPVKFALN